MPQRLQVIQAIGLFSEVCACNMCIRHHGVRYLCITKVHQQHTGSKEVAAIVVLLVDSIAWKAWQTLKILLP